MLRCCKNVHSRCSIILATYCAWILYVGSKTKPADNNDDDCDFTMLDNLKKMPFNNEKFKTGICIAENLLSKQSNDFLRDMPRLLEVD